MPRLVVTEQAAVGLEHCRAFLAGKNRAASRRAAEAIARSFAQLTSTPELGRPLRASPLRELVIAFGDTGYVALYRYEPDDDTAYVLAFRHQREAGYGP